MNDQTFLIDEVPGSSLWRVRHCEVDPRIPELGLVPKKVIGMFQTYEEAVAFAAPLVKDHPEPLENPK